MVEKNYKQIAAENEDLKKQVASLQATIDKSEDELLKENIELAEQNKQLETAGTASANQVLELKKQLAEVQGTGRPNIKGFLLDVDDPFGTSVISSYRKAGGKSSQPDRLPFVLPEGEEASKAALANYKVRADAAGDKERSKAVRKALPDVKKEK